jgi:hypothetical protein
MVQGREVHFDHNPLTDVMFVDLVPIQKNSYIETMDIGKMLGFPSQVLVRVDPRVRVLHGITIQNYSGFRRKLLWKYRMWSFQRAIELMISTLIAGLRLEQNYHNHQLI